jgi:hypothetical protein
MSRLSLTSLLLSAVACGGGAVHEERFELSSPVDELAIDVGSGDLEIVGADVALITVIAKVQGEANHLGSSVEGRRVELFANCNEKPCGLDISATVPSPLLLELSTGSGDITAKDLTGASVRVRTGSGDVSLRTAMPVEQLDAQTGSGDVDVAVPHGTYELELRTGSGGEHVEGISRDPAAAAQIKLTSGSGDISLHGR